jgi:hypothetical protein
MVQHGALHLFVCGALCSNVNNQTKDDMTRQEAINVINAHYGDTQIGDQLATG